MILVKHSDNKRPEERSSAYMHLGKGVCEHILKEKPVTS